MINKIEILSLDMLENISNIVLRIFDFITGREEFEREFDRQVAEQYQILSKKITIAKNEAQKKKKPLIILIGEDHSQINSALIEYILLNVVEKQLSITEILDETFFYKDCPLVPWFMKYREEILKEKNIKKIPIDLAFCDWVTFRYRQTPKECNLQGVYPQVSIHSSGCDPEEINIRNTVMADVTIKSTVADTVEFVGAIHLPGILEKTSLKDHFHILPINCAIDYSSDPHGKYKNFIGAFSDELKMLFHSEKILRSSINILKNKPPFYSLSFTKLLPRVQLIIDYELKLNQKSLGLQTNSFFDTKNKHLSEKGNFKENNVEKNNNLFCNRTIQVKEPKRWERIAAGMLSTTTVLTNLQGMPAQIDNGARLGITDGSPPNNKDPTFMEMFGIVITGVVVLSLTLYGIYLLCKCYTSKPLEGVNDGQELNQNLIETTPLRRICTCSATLKV